MKLLKKNKSLCFLLIIATIYVLVTLLYINPLRAKNTKLEEEYKQGIYEPLSVVQAVEICKEIVRIFALF